MAPRQERTVRTTKRAAKAAEEIIAHATTKAAQKPATPTKKALSGARTKPAPATASVGSEAATAAEVVRLRDEEGLSWVQIGAKLGLPGSKSGAATARKLYASTGKTFKGTTASNSLRPRLSDEEREARRKEREVRRAAARPTAVKERVRSGDHLIPLDTSDDELYAMLKGRKIKWSVDVGRLSGKAGEGPWLEEECYVHPDGFEVERDEDGGNPYLHFREAEGVRGEGLVATAFRTVRLASIHEVRG